MNPTGIKPSIQSNTEQFSNKTEEKPAKTLQDTAKTVDKICRNRPDQIKIDAKSVPQHNYGRVTLLVGTSTAGKTSIINALRALAYDFYETGVDLVVGKIVSTHLKEICPTECEKLSKILRGESEEKTNQNLFLAFCDTYHFAEGTTPEQQEEARDLIEEIKAKDNFWINNLSKEEKEDFDLRLNPNLHIKNSEFPEAIKAAKEGRNALFDILHINDLANELLTGDGVPIDKVLVYCPFSMLAERMRRRSEQAEARGDPSDKREGLFPFEQFASLYGPTEDDEAHLEILERDFVVQTFNKNFNLSNVFEGAIADLSEDEKKSKTDEHLKTFLKQLGFTGDIRQVKVSPRFKGYNLILNTGKLRINTCANTVLRQITVTTEDK